MGCGSSMWRDVLTGNQWEVCKEYDGGLVNVVGVQVGQRGRTEWHFGVFDVFACYGG